MKLFFFVDKNQPKLVSRIYGITRNTLFKKSNIS